MKITLRAEPVIGSRARCSAPEDVASGMDGRGVILGGFGAVVFFKRQDPRAERSRLELSSVKAQRERHSKQASPSGLGVLST